MTRAQNSTQPKALYVLFFAELWERFGFYSIQALLILYLSKAWMFSDTDAYRLFSAYSALTYATPMIGGYLADRFMGFRRSVFLGGFLYMAGYALLALGGQAFFYLALGLLIAGNTFFKPNVSSWLGTFYRAHDARRDSGFTIFYLGINIGTTLSPILCTYVAMRYGWAYGFGLAGIAMTFGMLLLFLQRRQLDQVSKPSPALSLSKQILIGLGIALTIYACAELLKHPQWVDAVIICVGIAAFFLLIYIAHHTPKAQKMALIGLLILMIFSIVFWALYMQMFLSMTLFIERDLDRTFFNMVIPTGMFAGVEGFMIIIFSPLFAYAWQYLNRKKWILTTPQKFASAILCVSAAFLCLNTGIALHPHAQLVPFFWVILSYLLFCFGELMLSPIGLSAVTAFSPPKWTGMIMGIWFMSLASAYKIAGHLAEAASIPLDHLAPELSKPLYAHTFNEFGIGAAIAGFLLWLFSPVLNRWMGETHSLQSGNA